MKRECAARKHMLVHVVVAIQHIDPVFCKDMRWYPNKKIDTSVRVVCRSAAVALDKAKDGHYQIACESVFEGLFGEKPNESVIHPNRYLADALEIQQRGQHMAEPSPVATSGRQNTQAVAGTPSGIGTPGLHTPGTSMSLQQQQSFMRTPINVTPTLGGAMAQSAQTPVQQVAETPPAIAGSPVAGLHKSA